MATFESSKQDVLKEAIQSDQYATSFLTQVWKYVSIHIVFFTDELQLSTMNRMHSFDSLFYSKVRSSLPTL